MQMLFAKNFTTVLLGIIVNGINGMFVFTFFKSSVFYNDPRYILYIHMVINDMLLVFFSVSLVVMAYAWPKVPLPFCVSLLIITSTAHKNTPLTLAGMAVERYNCHLQTTASPSDLHSAQDLHPHLSDLGCRSHTWTGWPDSPFNCSAFICFYNKCSL